MSAAVRRWAAGRIRRDDNLTLPSFTPLINHPNVCSVHTYRHILFAIIFAGFPANRWQKAIIPAGVTNELTLRRNGIPMSFSQGGHGDVRLRSA